MPFLSIWNRGTVVFHLKMKSNHITHVFKTLSDIPCCSEWRESPGHGLQRSTCSSLLLSLLICNSAFPTLSWNTRHVPTLGSLHWLFALLRTCPLRRDIWLIYFFTVLTQISSFYYKPPTNSTPLIWLDFIPKYLSSSVLCLT